VDVILGAGNHTLRMEYYENGGWASAELSWQPVANPCVATVPADRWRGEYWSNQTLSGTPTMVRDDGTTGLSFNWVNDSPGCGIGADHFSARWTRTLSFDAGTYRFTTRTDDGVRFFVDDVLRIDKWIDRGAASDSVDVILGAGNHTLRMEYYENGGWASAELSWAAATEFLCDDGDPCFGLFGPSDYWHLETACGGQSLGYGGDMYWTYVNGDTASNYARWTPTLGGAGTYEVRVFVPRCHATSQQAKYKIVHNGVTDYRTVNQEAISDSWFSLGSFAFAANSSEYVELSDATGEPSSSLVKIGFDAVHFVPAGNPPPSSGGWAFPVGSADSGAGWRVTLGLGQSWQDSDGKWYRGHLAEDWAPVGSSALGKPVYAAAAGQVVTVRQNCGSYVDVVIIKHQVDGISEPIYSFYGHIEADGYVTVGDLVSRRQQIGVIGNPVKFGPHLHFEIKNHTALINPPFSNCSNIPNGVYISDGYSGESGQYGGGDYYDPTNDGVVGNFYYHTTRFVTQHSGMAARALAASAPFEPTFQDGLPRCEELP
jgi:murein DD-endopeptidase MepM/ murein hydrolase activator NlpD